MHHYIACHDCDLLMENPHLEPGQKARCPRCAYPIGARGYNILDRLIALSFTSLLLLIYANTFPFLGFATRGLEQHVTLFESIAALWLHGYPTLSLLMGIFVLLVPALFLVGLLYLILSVRLGHHVPHGKLILNALFLIRPWAMAEVFTIGVLVSLIKVAALATIIPGISFWSFLIFCITFPATIYLANRHLLWEWLVHGYDQ